MNQRAAISRINKNGILLVFPINNRKLPKSLWSEFFPRSKMRWEWTEDSDDRIGDMWLLMKKLSDCRQVVYSKWYQGRATFFSRELFTAMLSIFKRTTDLHLGLSGTARHLLETLESDSPLSTKELKKLTDLQGRFNESNYTRSMKELFSRFVIVAFGEVEDGAFPSLAVGSTRNLYEELWLEADQLAPESAEALVERFLPPGSPTRKYFDSVLKKLKLSAQETMARPSVPDDLDWESLRR